MRPRNVRTRLTAWYVTVLAVTLLIYCGGTAALVFHELRGELDRLAIDDLEGIEGLLSFNSAGHLSFRSDYHDHPYPTSEQDRLLEVRAEDGRVLYRNALLGSRSLGGAPEQGEGADGYTVRTIRLSDGTRARVISKRHVIDDVPTLVRVGFSEEILWQRFWEIFLSMMAGLPFALGLAAAGGYFLARHALKPIEEMARRIHEINAEHLNQRLRIENPDDELGVLARAFNDTLARLERSFEQLRRFTTDASHELRTPLTAIRSVGEVGLKNLSTREEYREVIGSMLEEANRLNQLVDSLLMIARADSGQIQLNRTPVLLLPFVHERLCLLEVLAEEKGQTISIAGDGHIEVDADPTILGHILINLMDNAIKNSPLNAPIALHIRNSEDERAVIEIKDSGPGIPPEDRDRVFDRFYRVDEGRSRESGGTGLGLAIAKWGAEAHGGQLQLECPPEGGCVFRLRIPLLARTAREEGRTSPEYRTESLEIDFVSDETDRPLSLEKPV
jgi:heavy metal sensor kinase